MSTASLFSPDDLRPSGTKIKKLIKYIGVDVDAIDVYCSTHERKRGKVYHIEKIEVNGYPHYRVELENKMAFGFGSEQEVINFFESKLVLTKQDFNEYSRKNKMCFVSSSQSLSQKVWIDVKSLLYDCSNVVSITLEEMHLYKKEFDFFSLDTSIYDRGTKIQRVFLNIPDFYQAVKESEKSGVFHIVKNYANTTSCGKELKEFFDPQEITSFTPICKKCFKKYNINWRK